MNQFFTTAPSSLFFFTLILSYLTSHHPTSVNRRSNSRRYQNVHTHHSLSRLGLPGLDLRHPRQDRLLSSSNPQEHRLHHSRSRRHGLDLQEIRQDHARRRARRCCHLCRHRPRQPRAIRLVLPLPRSDRRPDPKPRLRHRFL